jgi:hypothetical protein
MGIVESRFASVGNYLRIFQATWWESRKVANWIELTTMAITALKTVVGQQELSNFEINEDQQLSRLTVRQRLFQSGRKTTVLSQPL